MTGKRYMPDEKVGQFVKDMLANKFFFSTQLRDHEYESLLPMVFMPLIFMSDEDRQEIIDNKVDVFYGPYETAAPRSVNGYPFLMEVGYLTREDWNAIVVKYDAAKKAMDAALGVTPEEPNKEQKRDG